MVLQTLAQPFVRKHLTKGWAPNVTQRASFSLWTSQSPFLPVKEHMVKKHTFTISAIALETGFAFAIEATGQRSAGGMLVTVVGSGVAKS